MGGRRGYPIWKPPEGKGRRTLTVHSMSGHSWGFGAESRAVGQQHGLCCVTALRVDRRW